MPAPVPIECEPVTRSSVFGSARCAARNDSTAAKDRSQWPWSVEP
ncbi:hypothetical protein [Nonomuraea aridisoli]|nr:hypothetical protein [Nonomuraea aridisoli]